MATLFRFRNGTWAASVVAITNPIKFRNCKDNIKSLVNNEIVIGERQNELCSNDGGDNGGAGVNMPLTEVKNFKSPPNSTPMPNEITVSII